MDLLQLTIGNYRIEKLLGSGGMADVYLATHMLLKKKFAIKIMKPELGRKDPLMAKRFVREAQLAQKVEHPNIVKVYDVGNDPNTGLLYIVMEYVEGENLFKYSQGKHPSSQKVREIAYEMTKALMELNRMGIVHRDIKPSNIMLCKDGSIKLMDLGIAKAVANSGEEGVMTLTMDQAVLGTPAFSSPEQCRNAKSVDIRSDIYCLGASLYSIATGNIPYGGTTAMEILLKVIEEKPRPLAEIRPDLDADLIHLIESMMEKAPDKRPQTPQELLLHLVSREGDSKWKKYLKAVGAAVALLVAVFAIGCIVATAIIRYAPDMLAGKSGTEANTSPVRPNPRTSEANGVAQGTKPGDVVAQGVKPVDVVAQGAKPVDVVAQGAKPGDVVAQGAKPVDVVAQGTKPVDVVAQGAKPGDGIAQAQNFSMEEKSLDKTLALKQPLPKINLELQDYVPKHITLSERVDDIKKKIAKDNFKTKLSDHDIIARIFNLARDGNFVTQHFKEFKALVHLAQNFCLKEQIKCYERSRKTYLKSFDEEATKKMQKSFEAYTQERTDWGYNDKDLKFSDNLLALLKTGKINPNAEVVDSTYNQYSGPLLKAILSGRIQKRDLLIEELLKQGADANAVLDRTPQFASTLPLVLFKQGGIDKLENKLIPALKQGSSSIEIIHVLLLLNHDVTETDELGNTALHHAAKNGMFDVVALLVASGANINAKNDIGETPLFYAERSYSQHVKKLLLALGADASIANSDGKKAEDFRELGLFINSALKCDLKTLQMYLQKGYSPDTIIPSNKNTLLEYACSRRNTKMVELLLAYKAKPDLKSSQRYTSLAMVMGPRNENLAIFTRLLEAGAEPNTNPQGFGGKIYLLDNLVRDSYGLEGKLQFFKALLATGKARFGEEYSYKKIFMPEMRNFLSLYIHQIKEFANDEPILLVAISQGLSDEFILQLLNKKANVNCSTNGYLPSILSSKYTSLFPIKDNWDSVTALAVAVRMRRTSTVRLLLQHGANRRWVSKRGIGIMDIDTSSQIKALLQE